MCITAPCAAMPDHGRVSPTMHFPVPHPFPLASPYGTSRRLAYPPLSITGQPSNFTADFYLVPRLIDRFRWRFIDGQDRRRMLVNSNDPAGRPSSRVSGSARSSGTRGETRRNAASYPRRDVQSAVDHNFINGTTVCAAVVRYMHLNLISGATKGGGRGWRSKGGLVTPFATATPTEQPASTAAATTAARSWLQLLQLSAHVIRVHYAKTLRAAPWLRSPRASDQPTHPLLPKPRAPPHRQLTTFHRRYNFKLPTVGLLWLRSDRELGNPRGGE